jgi:hypothetical protein
MKKTEEQLKYLIDMYQKILDEMPSDQELYTKAEDEHNWFEEEDYPPYVPLIEEINELGTVLHGRQKVFIEEMIELRLEKGIAGRESKDYYSRLIFVWWKEAHELINKFISDVLNSNLKDREKDDQIDFLKKLALGQGSDVLNDINK